MKTLRLWLLLLMAVLLPVRGAIAAAWPCAGEGLHQAAVQASAVAHVRPPAHHPAQAMPEVADPSAALGHAGLHHHDGHAGDGKCNVCASCCSTTPMVATFSLSIAPPDEPPARFPALRASPATFVSEGQERPPRSI